MAKTSPQTLGQLITPDLATYLGDGVLNPRQLARSIDYSGLNIERFDQLKKLHFVLYDDVVEYIRALPTRLRRIKTTHRQTESEARGEIRGAIDWPRTIERRANTGYTDRSLFVVTNPETEIDIPENRVVKKLLATINEPLTDDIETINQDWQTAWDDASITALQRILAQNVYLDALPAPEEITLSNRDLTRARRARQQLYSEGASLYRLYDDLMNDRFHRDGVQDVFRETIVISTQDHKLFELFCVFAFIRHLQDLYPGLQLRRIEPQSDAMAVLEGEHEQIVIYYDQGGPLSFFEEYPTPAELHANYDVPDSLYRQASATDEHSRLVEEFFSRGTRHTFYSGRPDFVALRSIHGAADGRIEDAIVGEVKYTQAKSTFSKGLRELLEYLYFAKEGDEFLFDNQLDPDQMYGVLCTDGVSTEVNNVRMIHHWESTTLQQEF